MTPRIVCLDGHTLNPGNLDWAPFEALGELTIYPRTGVDAVERAAGAECVLTNKHPISTETFAALPDLRYVGVLATGVNVVDLHAAAEHNVTVTNVPGYGDDSVSQHVFALLLDLTNQANDHSEAVHHGQWTESPDFCFTLSPLTELAGKKLGIVGVGAIGRRVAAIGAAFGMQILAAEQRSMHAVQIPGVDIEWLPLDELFAAADVVTLHCPLTPKTKHMVNAERLARMKRSAILINTGRGPLIDEGALAAALQEGRLFAAALDVLSVEPPPADNPLLAAPRCLITPHIAWATREARARLMQIAAANLAAFLRGEPQNVVHAK